MASKTPRATLNLSRQALRQYRTHAAPSSSTSCPFASPCSRPFSTSASRPSEEAAADDLPRWSYTPERMKAPFRIGIRKTPIQVEWVVNDDPKKLDTALNSFLGRDGDRLLPEELKWLAVTHKSFDQARRGFNDRLAFLGRNICVMEAMHSIVNSPADYKTIPADQFADRREPFEDPSLRSLDNLFQRQPMDFFQLDKLSKLAKDTGLADVVRWTPKMAHNLKGSGFQPVMSGAVFAVIGALALQNGTRIASKIARERVLKRIIL